MLATDQQTGGNVSDIVLSGQQCNEASFRRLLSASPRSTEFLSSIRPLDEFQLAYLNLKLNGKEMFGLLDTAASRNFISRTNKCLNGSGKAED